MFNLITQQYIKGSDYEKSFKVILIVASHSAEFSITARRLEVVAPFISFHLLILLTCKVSKV